MQVKDYGEVWVVAPDWAAGAVEMHDNGFTLHGNSRLYFASRAEDGWSPDMYWQTPLNNKHFAYTLVSHRIVSNILDSLYTSHYNLFRI